MICCVHSSILQALCQTASAVPRQGGCVKQKGEGACFRKRGSPLYLFWFSAFCSPRYAFLYSRTSDEVMLPITPVLHGVCAQDRGMFLVFTPSLRMPTLWWRCGRGGAETADAPCSAPEHLGGNHSQSPHDNRIAHSLDEPGL